MHARILVATDLSEQADRAVLAADALADRDNARLGVVHVMPNLQPLSMLFPQGVAKGALDSAALERRAGEIVQERVAKLAKRPPETIDVFVDAGTDYAAIVKHAETWKADLVVVGSHGHTGMTRALMGSVSEKVVRYAHTNVLVIRPAPEKGPVVAATDLSDASLAAVDVAAYEAKKRGVDLYVLHAVDTLPLVAGNVAGMPLGLYGLGLDAESAEGLVTAAKGAVEGALSARKIQGHAEALRGTASAAIVQRAEELGASLIVTTTHGRTGLSRVVLGSVAESIVRHAPCATLVVRHKA